VVVAKWQAARLKTKLGPSKCKPTVPKAEARPNFILLLKVEMLVSRTKFLFDVLKIRNILINFNNNYFII
jgi:hypothetical protein